MGNHLFIRFSDSLAVLVHTMTSLGLPVQDNLEVIQCVQVRSQYKWLSVKGRSNALQIGTFISCSVLFKSCRQASLPATSLNGD